MPIPIDLRQAIYALTDALDLVGVDERGHGKRVGFMAVECGRLLGLDPGSADRLFHAGLLHDCGVSSTSTHRHLVEELDWPGSDDHCRRGFELLNGFPPLTPLAGIVRYHHTHWEVLRDLDVPDAERSAANLIFLVDRADAMAAPHYGRDLLLAREGIRQRIAALAGTLFDPGLVESFMEISSSEAFWMNLEPPHLERFLFDMERDHCALPMDFDQLKRLATLFAHIVDAKSRFTVEHSLGVARLARHLAGTQGLSPETRDKIEVAGLLHDLGKLRIPDEILDKPGALDAAERATMLRHSFETYQILRRIGGLEDIALWAAYHHEAPDGRGYPFHRHGSELGLEARIIAAADVFQALAQDRPYRPALPLEQILAIMGKLAADGHLDAGLYDAIRTGPEICLTCAQITSGAQPTDADPQAVPALILSPTSVNY